MKGFWVIMRRYAIIMDFTKLKKIAKSAPDSPGIYKMLDKTGTIIYIGKAKNLKNRILQYFQESKHHTMKTKKMIEQIEDVNYIETPSDLEAYILETNLIKQFRPKYNILMRDDKSFVYIKITVQEDFPKVYIVRRVLDDGAKYFGPKTSKMQVEKTLNLLRKIFKYCTCNLEMQETEGKLIVKGRDSVPCLDYHIKRCLGPCIGAVNKAAYHEMIQQVIQFLSGKYGETITDLNYQMLRLAGEKKFEAAASIRNQIQAIKDIFTTQLISEPNLVSRDVIGYLREFDKTYVNLFQFRSGKLVGQENFTLMTPENEEERATESFLQWYYSESTDFPDEIFLRNEPDSKEWFERWLKEKAGKAVHVITPLKGKKNKTLEMSEKNALSYARQSKVKWISDSEKTSGACRELAESLGLEKELKRIECYDISHIAGMETVGSMVVFIDGAPDPSHYRRFHIKTLTTGKVDDYASMHEVLFRRLKKLSEGEKSSDGYEIAKALKKDHPFILDIIEKESLSMDHFDWKEVLVLKKDNAIVGFGRLKSVGEYTLISSLWIGSEHRGKKLGYRIMQKLIERSDAKNIYLICREQFREYQEKFGFRELKKAPETITSLHDPSKKRLYFMYQKTKKSTDASFASKPDLIIIDGGKGQLSAALDAGKAAGINTDEISFCSLAKQQEEIFLPGKSSGMLLPRNSQALYLVQRIRDEAHRFAHDFNRSSHVKKIVKSQLDQIPGVGAIMKRKLLKTFGSVHGIKDAPIEELIKCCGEYIANKLKENL